MTEDRSGDLREWYAEDDIGGADLLDELLDTIKKYVVFPDDDAPVAVTLWIATTHALPAFECAPRLVLTSPQKRCAKSRTLDIISGTCHRPLPTSDATVAAIFRSISGDHPPTLIFDEADLLFGSKRSAEQNEDLKKLLNAGHQRGRPAIRCVGPLQTSDGSKCQVSCPVRVNGTNEMDAKPFSAEVLCTGRRDGEVVCCCERRSERPVEVGIGDDRWQCRSALAQSTSRI